MLNVSDILRVFTDSIILAQLNKNHIISLHIGAMKIQVQEGDIIPSLKRAKNI